MRRNLRPTTIAASLLAALLAVVVAMPSAFAQDLNEIVDALEADGYYIEPGAEPTGSELSAVVRRADSTGETWYFVAMAESVNDGFEDDIFASVTPQGNVVLHFLDDDGFDNLWLSSDLTQNESDDLVEAALDADISTTSDVFNNLLDAYDRSASSASSGNSSSGGTTTTTPSGSSSSGGTTTTTPSGSTSSDSGGGFPWGWIAVPAVLGGGFWFVRRSGNKKKDEAELESAQKLRAGIQTELDELANDVIVLGSPIDLSNKPDAIQHYREATDTYLTISDELPDVDKLQDADLDELAELGSRISHARWQMDAAEAIMDGEPLPEKPKVPPPPAPAKPPAPREQQRQRMPQRQARPRVPYSPSRRRSGGGLLDILIAGAGMTANRRGRNRNRNRSRNSGGGMFGGSSGGFGNSSSNQRRTTSAPRPGGGVFGGGSRSGRSSSSNRRSSSRSSSRSRRANSRRSANRKARSSSRGRARRRR